MLVLVVEDEASIREIYTEILQMKGAEVVVASDATEGLELLKEHSPDSVISDLNMPGMDGWALLQEVNKISPECNRILITGCVMDDDRVVAAQKDGVKVFFKPSGATSGLDAAIEIPN